MNKLAIYRNLLSPVCGPQEAEMLLARGMFVFLPLMLTLQLVSHYRCQIRTSLVARYGLYTFFFFFFYD